MCNSFNNLYGIPSGPLALFGSKLLNTAATSSSNSSISERRKELGWKQEVQYHTRVKN